MVIGWFIRIFGRAAFAFLALAAAGASQLAKLHRICAKFDLGQSAQADFVTIGLVRQHTDLRAGIIDGRLLGHQLNIRLSDRWI